MFHKQLVIHISTKLKEGEKIEAIATELLADGWSKKDIEEAYLYALAPKKLKHFSLHRFLHSEVPVVITLGFFIALVAVFAGSFFFIKTNINYKVTFGSASAEESVPFVYGEQPALANPEFFQKVKNQFITQRANFIEVDLSTMIARVYKEGTVVVDVPVKTIGREGSWWETPAGLYKVSSKEPEHFSGMGHVYMPWSMNFQGNFFIHGWPYYPDGTPVATSYSGGCIRLANDDAKKIYDEAQVGMPILVFKKDFIPDTFSYVNAIPSLSSSAYMIADLKSNFVFLNKKSTAEMPIASITKLMTALVTTEYINLDNSISVSKDAIVPTSKSRLSAGMNITVYQLLFPLLMESSNEAAEAIARSYGRDSFIKKMNDKAASLGMTHTHFVDSSGVGEDNVSTIEDLFMLTKYIYNNRSFIFKITAGKLTTSAYGENQFKDLGNFNSFAGMDSYVGGKVGKSTAAQETELAVFEIPFGTEKRPLAAIVLGSQESKTDISAILNYVKNNFAEK